MPLFGLPFVMWPGLVNPDWKDGMPLVEISMEMLIYVGLGLVMWTVFGSRLELREDLIRIVNLRRIHGVPCSALVTVQSRTRGLMRETRR